MATFRLGVVDTPFRDTTADIQAMQRANVATLRTTFSWSAIEVQPPTADGCHTALYDFSAYDRIVSQAATANVRILAVIGFSPPYVGPTRISAPHTEARSDMRAYRCFLDAVVSRYGRGGSFITPGVRPVVEWQIWNEPNLPNYASQPPGRTGSTGKVDPREYGRFLKASRAVIVRRDARATIVTAGLVELSRAGMNSDEFLRGFYRVKGIKSQFHALGFHPYAENHLGVEGAMTRLRKLLRNLGDRGRYVWVTEVGYATDGPQGHWAVNTEQGQATKLRKTIALLKQNRDRWRVGTVHWFRWRDVPNHSAQLDWSNFAGLYRQNGTPKPSCGAFVQFTGGRCPDIAGVGAMTSSAPSTDLGARTNELVLPSPPE